MNKGNLDFEAFAAKLILNHYDSDKLELEIEKYYNENFNKEQKFEIDKFIRNVIHEIDMAENKKESLAIFKKKL